ncbi:GAF domain-containing sensor histidine kinase [Mesorhizobium sp. A556]
MPHDFQADIDTIDSIDAVSTILDVVCRTTGMGFAAVARVTESRWIACKVLDSLDFGLAPGSELKVEATICNDIRESRAPIVISNAAEHETYSSHPGMAAWQLKSYISIPIIRRDGRFFGTLCAMGPHPANLNNPETIGMFTLFAELIASHLDIREQLMTVKADLAHERELSELRDQFIAVLGHDLRNPVSSIDSGAKMLLHMPLDAKSRKILDLMQGSVVRMRGLIDNVLDFARARLGGGVTLDTSRTLLPVQDVLEQVLGEIRSIEPGREIQADFSLTDPIEVDHARLGQLFSNLLANALVYGDSSAPVRTGALTRDGYFELWVSNAGEPIPATMLDNLFKPFFRGTVRPSQQGLGLGLYIASEIARAHGGTLTALSNRQETRFTFRMPLHSA